MKEDGVSLIEIAFVVLFIVLVIVGFAGPFLDGSHNLISVDSSMLQKPQVLDDINTIVSGNEDKFKQISP